ncbi:hypothetical protein, partial [Streptomyces sp. NPDC050388]|uniref:hypothetical protein n=1 Tax=Streptomyces sp. NPDC050388 TaxID=3155781 RepID=UPI003420871B
MLIPAVAGVSLFAPATLHDTSSQARTEQPVVQQENIVGADGADGAVSADRPRGGRRGVDPPPPGNPPRAPEGAAPT